MVGRKTLITKGKGKLYYKLARGEMWGSGEISRGKQMKSTHNIKTSRKTVLDLAISNSYPILNLLFAWMLSCHYIYYRGQESLRSNGAALIVNKIQTAVCGWSLKNDRMTSVRFQGKPFNITVIHVYTLTSNAEEAEVEWFYEDLQDLL